MKNIESIKNNLRDYDYIFLQNLERYIDAELFFYGSIARADFFPEYSDIDIIIITDNVNSVLKKIQNFLGNGIVNLEKTVNYMHEFKNMSYAYKISYEDLENNLYLEIFIYDDKYKKQLIYDINKKNSFPFYIVAILYILKFLTYRLKLLSENSLKYLKNNLINLYLRQSTNKYMVNLKV
jgi:predicted nucleotidyltransferase